MALEQGARGNLYRACVFFPIWLWAAWAAIAHPISVPPGGHYLIDNWETDDGLPESSGTAMAQTADGYLWFGTFNGLVRFDGVHFKIFDTGNTPELPSPGIVNLHLDARGRLWVSTLKGLVVLDHDRWIDLSKNPTWPGDYVRTFAESAGVMCLTSFNWKVARVDSSGKIEALPDPPGSLDSGCFAYVDPSGRAWVIKREFAGFWDGKKWQDTEVSKLVEHDMRGAAVARDGSLLVLQTSSLLRIRDGHLVSSLVFNKALGGAWNLCEDHEGNVWISGIETGLHSLSPSGLLTYYGSTNGVPYNSVRFTAEDRERNLWVGTSGGGVFRLKRRTFTAYGMENGLPERMIKSIAETKSGSVYLGTYGKDVVKLEDGVPVPLPGAGTTPGGFIQTLLADHEDRLWVGSFASSLNDVGLFIYSDGIRKAVSSLDSGGRTVSALFEDSKHRLWIGGDKTAVYQQSNSFTATKRNGGGDFGRVRTFAENPLDGSIWAINDEGLFRFESGEWQELKLPSGRPFSEGSGLAFDRNGSLWTGLRQTGLIRIREGQTAIVSQAQGLPSSFLSCLLDDGLGYWWIGCNKGVMRVAKKDLDRAADGTLAKLQLQLYTTSDGLPSSECTTELQPAGLKDSRGRLWFATTKGAAMIDPHFPDINTNRPSVHIERVSYIDQKGASQESQVVKDREIIIPPGSQELEIEYDALTYRAPEKVQFAYRLGGDSTAWNDAGDRRSVFFHTLHSGQLNLSIKAANDSGFWNETGTSVSLRVEPFFWQTLWFQAAATSGVALALGFGVWRLARARLQLRIQKLEHDRNLAQEQARLAAIVESSDDAIIGIDLEGNIASWNRGAEEILGYTAQEVVGKPFRDAVPSGTPADEERLLGVLQKGNRVQGYQSRFRGKAGRASDLSITVSPIFDSAGNPAGASMIARDITESKRDRDNLQRTLADLERSNKELEQFAYVASHDLQEPLRAVAGCVQILAKRYQDKLDKAGLELVDHAVDGSQRMQTLIHDLLALSRVGSRGGVLVPVASGEACQRAIKNLAAALEESGADVRCGPLPTVVADATQLTQLFQNLIGNAIKYRGSRKPIIQISAKKAGKFWQFAVQDNGIGIEPQYFDRIFGVFQRLHTRLEYPGTGIGLAICKKIAERHGGRIWVESTPGEGSTMFFTLCAPAEE